MIIRRDIRLAVGDHGLDGVSCDPESCWNVCLKLEDVCEIGISLGKLAELNQI